MYARVCIPSVTYCEVSASSLRVSQDSWVPPSALSATKTSVSPSQDPRDPTRARNPAEEPCPPPLLADR